MLVRLKKAKDAAPTVTFVRADGSSTTGRLGSGEFGPAHDLAHYAVETTLGLSQGFYGLMAAGWDIADFGIKGTGPRLPAESIVTECLVGQLSNVVFARQEITAEDFNWLVHQAATALRPGAIIPALDEDTLRLLRARFGSLLARWRELPPGDTLELGWPK